MTTRGDEGSSPQPTQSEIVTPEPAATSQQQSMVPDVVGMNADQASDTLELMGLEVDLDADRWVLVKSNWTVTKSDPAPETKVDFGSTVTLTVEKLSEDSEDEDLRVTDDGLTQGMAMTVCTRAGNEQFPGGFDIKAIGGVIDVSHESIHIDVEVEVVEGSATRTTHMECTVSGTDDQPTLSDFLVY